MTGDGCNIKRDFVIGKEFFGQKELAICFLRSLLILRLCSIPILIGIFIIIFPWGGNIKIAKDLENAIEGRDNYKMKRYSHYGYFVYLTKLILLGPFIIRERYMLINFSSKIAMFIAALYPVVFPNHLFKPIYGVNGYSFLCFIVIGTRIQFEEWALQMTYCYYLVVILINAIYLGGAKYYKKFKNGNLVFFINSFLTFAFWSGGIYINIRFVGESIWWPYLFLTPIYVIIPIILKIIIHFYTYVDQRGKILPSKLVEEKEDNEV